MSATFPPRSRLDPRAHRTSTKNQALRAARVVAVAGAEMRQRQSERVPRVATGSWKSIMPVACRSIVPLPRVT